MGYKAHTSYKSKVFLHQFLQNVVLQLIAKYLMAGNIH